MKTQLFLLCLLLNLSSCISIEPKNNFEIYITSQSQELTAQHLKAIKNRLAPSSADVIINTEGSHQARITLKTNTTEDYIRTLLKTPGSLAFYETASIEQIMPAIIDVYTEELNPERNRSIKHFNEVFMASPPNIPPFIGISNIKDTALINHTLHAEKVQALLKKEYLNVKFTWGIPDTSDKITLYALVLNSFGKPAMHGNFIENARQTFSQIGKPTINIAMNPKAARDWEVLTRRAAEDRFAIAIVIDNQVYAAPMAIEAITGGQTEISGNYTVENAQSLTQVISTNVIPQLEITKFTTNNN